MGNVPRCSKGRLIVRGILTPKWQQVGIFQMAAESNHSAKARDLFGRALHLFDVACTVRCSFGYYIDSVISIVLVCVFELITKQ